MLRRRTAAAAVLLATAGLLAACDKPLPDITVLAGATVHRVGAQYFCFDANSCRRGTTAERTIGASSGSRLLIDVPRTVARRHWIVTATTVDSAGTVTPVQGAGSALTYDRHSVRVDVPPVSPGETYRLAVDTLDGQRSSGHWSMVVRVTS